MDKYLSRLITFVIGAVCLFFGILGGEQIYYHAHYSAKTAGVAATAPAAPPAHPPRFILRSTEYHGYRTIEIWEDTLMKRETVCFYDSLAVPSCYQTGRVNF
jgi:hypothetical protein